jgi:hypothetical protein
MIVGGDLIESQVTFFSLGADADGVSSRNARAARHAMDFDFAHAIKTFLAFAGAAALFYQAVAALNNGAPMRMVVNPYRRQWLLAGFSVITVAYSGIAFTADNKWDPLSILAELEPLVTQGKTPLRVVVGSLMLLLGFGLMASVAYCWWVFPRDPKSFDVGKQSPDVTIKNVNRALKHYVSRPGGMEYAAVIVLPPMGRDKLPSVEELLKSRDMNEEDASPYRMMEYLGSSELKGIRRKRQLSDADQAALEKDRVVWLQLAMAAHPSARQQAFPCLESNLGDVTLLQTRTRFGGYLFEYLYPAKDDEPDFLLFGVTMNSGETNGSRFYEHFAMLRQAVRYMMPDKHSLGETVYPTALAVEAAPPPVPVEPEPAEAPEAAAADAAPVEPLPDVADNPVEEQPALEEPATTSAPA